MAVLTPEGKQSYEDSAGNPLIGGLLHTYDTGTLNPRITWSDAAQSAQNTNPIVLNARGECTIFGTGVYTFALETAASVPIWTQDDITVPELSGTSATLEANLASTNLATLGAGQIGHNSALPYPVGTVGYRLNLMIVNVKDFGAVGNGSTNDTVAFQAAIDFVYAAGGGEIYIPHGDYGITTLVRDWPNAIISINIRGSGKQNTILRKFGATTTPIFDLSSVPLVLEIDSKFSDFWIIGNNKTHHGFRLTNVAELIFDNIKINSCDVGIQSFGSLVMSFYDADFFDNRYGYTCIASAGITCNDVEFFHGTFALNTVLGVAINGSNGHVFFGTRFEGNGTAGQLSSGGVRLDAGNTAETGFSNMSFYNNHFESNKGENFVCQTQSGGGGLYLGLYDMRIYAPEGGRSLNIGGIGGLIIRNLVAASPGDTVTTGAVNLIVENSTIAALVDTSVRHQYTNLTTNSGTNTFEQTPPAIDSFVSAATSTFPLYTNVFLLLGPIAITNITPQSGRIITLIMFDTTASLVDGGNLRLAGNFTGTANDVLTLVSDATNWYEVSRSVN